MNNVQAKEISPKDRMAVLRAAFASGRNQEDENKAKDIVAVPATKPDSFDDKIGQQLTFFPEKVGVLPTEVTRTSLFALLPSKREHKKVYKEKIQLPSRSDVTIYYTGDALGKYDETAWMAAIRLCRDVKVGERKYLLMTDILRELDLEDTTQNRTAIKTRFDRLASGVVTIDFTRGNKKYHMVTGLMKWGWEGSSIDGIQDPGGRIYLRLDPDGAQLLENMSYVPWEIRRTLSSPPTMALMSYASGHEAGKLHAVNLMALQKMLGYEGRTRDFRKKMQQAGIELQDLHFFGKNSFGFRGRGNEETAYWKRS